MTAPPSASLWTRSVRTHHECRRRSPVERSKPPQTPGSPGIDRSVQFGPATSCVVVLLTMRPAGARSPRPRRRGRGSWTRRPAVSSSTMLLATFGAPNGRPSSRRARRPPTLARLTGWRSRRPPRGHGGGDAPCRRRNRREPDPPERGRERLCPFERGTSSPRRGERGIAVHAYPGVTVIPPGDLSPGDSQPLQGVHPVLESLARCPAEAATPGTGSIPAVGRSTRALPELGDPEGTGVASNLPEGGETAARSRLSRWLREGLARYDTRRDDLAIAGTSGPSPTCTSGARRRSRRRTARRPSRAARPS